MFTLTDEVPAPAIQRDHAGGNEKLISIVSGLTVCGNDDRIGALNKRVKHNESFKVIMTITP